MNLLKRAWRLLIPGERRLAVVMIALMVICAGLESAAVALFFPFLAILQNPDAAHRRVASLPLAHPIASWSGSDLTLGAAVVLLAFFMVKNALVYASVRQQSRFVYQTQSAMATRLLAQYLRAPWAFHLRRNPGDLLRSLTHDVTVLFGNVLLSYITLFSEGLVTLLVLLLLIAIDPLTSVLAIVGLGGSTLVFYRAIRRRTDRLGRDQQQGRGGMIRWINQGLGGTKEIRVLRREQFFIDGFAAEAARVGNANVHLNVVNQAPRLYFETLLVGAITLAIGLAAARGRTGADYLPTLALLGAAAFRLLPAANRVVSTISNIRYHRPSVDTIEADVTELAAAASAGQAAAAGTPLTFHDAIVLDDVSYRYEGAAGFAVQQISLRIPRGASIAIEGRSGAGKTTLMDIILGLLPPSAGRVLVDGRDIQSDLAGWQQVVGYIPQSVYLSDASIRANVAFGIPAGQIDDERVWAALRDASLDDVIKAQPGGLDTEAGERGVRLSGGQRQRLAIARVLYNQPEILVLDEATASLDDETEREVIAALDRFRGVKTMLVISHKPSTTAHCDVRAVIEQGRLTQIVDAVHA